MRKLIFIFVLVLLIPAAALAQGNAFNFQGRLNDGTNPANGQYDLQFKLFDAITGGTQIGSTISRPATVLINGVFSVNIDFGAAAFINPNTVFIEIGVKPAGLANDLASCRECSNCAIGTSFVPNAIMPLSCATAKRGNRIVRFVRIFIIGTDFNSS